jgi:hypothetical protein
MQPWYGRQLRGHYLTCSSCTPPEFLVFMSDLIADLRVMGERVSRSLAQIGLLDDGSRGAVWIENAAIPFSRRLAVNAHRADEYQPLNSRGVHRLNDRASLPRHVAGEVGIYHVLSLHGGPQSGRIEHIALDNGRARRIGIGQSAGPTLVQRKVGSLSARKTLVVLRANCPLAPKTRTLVAMGSSTVRNARQDGPGIDRPAL